MHQLDAVDKAILMILQRGIPVASRPYQLMAEAIGQGVTEQAVIDRIALLKEENIIRRMSGFFNSGKLGYASALCAIKVQPDKMEEVAQVVNAYPGVTHNYVRDHEFNMWFTLIARSAALREQILDEIEASPYVDKVLRLYTNRRYKINVTFDLEGAGTHA